MASDHAIPGVTFQSLPASFHARVESNGTFLHRLCVLLQYLIEQGYLKPVKRLFTHRMHVRSYSAYDYYEFNYVGRRHHAV